MTKSKIEDLQEENERLRTLILSLSVTSLRKAVQQPKKTGRACDTRDAERLTREAEKCFRCAKMPSINAEIAAGLDAAGHAFMAKAVEIETSLQRARRKK